MNLTIDITNKGFVKVVHQVWCFVSSMGGGGGGGVMIVELWGCRFLSDIDVILR